jgi:hypothetical protein
MNAVTIAVIVAVAVVVVLLVMRRDRPRSIGGGDGRTPAPTQPYDRGPGSRIDPALSNLSDVDRAEIEREIVSGKKIAAIKLVREKTGMGLKESKDFVEDFLSGDRG